MPRKAAGTPNLAHLSDLPQVATWDKAIIFFMGRGKTAKTTNARIFKEAYKRAGRNHIAYDLEPMNDGLSSCFPPNEVVKPTFSILKGSELAEVVFGIAKRLVVEGGVALVDTPGNFTAMVELAEITALTQTIRSYGVKLIFFVCCGAESDDLKLLEAIAAVSPDPPDCVILAVTMKGLAPRFRDNRLLTTHFASNEAVQSLMSGVSEVILVPECDALEQLDGKCIEIHRAASAPPLEGIEPYHGAMIRHFLDRYKKLFTKVLPCA